MAVTIASGEIHPAVRSARVFAQDLLDHAHALDELSPVHRAEKSQAADGVTDGNLVAGLLLSFRLNQLLDREAVLRETLLDPGERQCQSRALSL